MLFEYIDNVIIKERTIESDKGTLYFQNIWNLYGEGILTLGKFGYIPPAVKKYISLIVVMKNNL